MKLPLSAAEQRLLRDLFDPRRAPLAFPTAAAEAARLHGLLAARGEPDLPRADVEALTRLLGAYLERLAGSGVPVPGQAPLDATVGLVEAAPRLQQLHTQLRRHLDGT